MHRTQNVASFVLRFTQELWQDAQGEPHIQWRGHIRHVQGDAEDRFTDFAEAVAFIQHYLTQLTLDALQGNPMSKERVIQESFKMWERFASSYTDLMFQAMEQTFKQSETFQEQMVEARNKALKAWQIPGQSDQSQILQTLAELQAQIQALTGKVESLEKILHDSQNS